MLASGRIDVDIPTAARTFVGPLMVHALVNVLLVAPEAEQEPAAPMDVDALVDLFLAAVAVARAERIGPQRTLA